LVREKKTKKEDNSKKKAYLQLKVMPNLLDINILQKK